MYQPIQAVHMPSTHKMEFFAANSKRVKFKLIGKIKEIKTT